MTKVCGVPLQLDRYREPDTDGPRCALPRKRGHVKCQFHWLMRQPIEVQIKAAEQRLAPATALGMHRARVPAAECPDGERWCAGCQSFIPLFYAQGSRCRACNSQAAHAGHVERTYGLDPAEYQRLLDWQGGVCFICGQVPRVRRLAVDHEHRTGEVRGLLCANDEWGCNRVLARLLNDVEVARRALEYVERHPLERMRAGEPGRPRPRRRDAQLDSLRQWPGTTKSQPLSDWDPFGEKAAG